MRSVCLSALEATAKAMILSPFALRSFHLIAVSSFDAPVLSIVDVLEVERHRMPAPKANVGQIGSVPVYGRQEVGMVVTT